MSSKKLFLLDAMALIYRAHFAFSKNPRVNSKGMSTGAVLGFTNTLWDIIKREQPTHIAVAFDTPKPTFRHVQFPEYKAQREAQPEDITVAIPYVKKMVKAFNIQLLEMDGFEADDVIGTIAKRCPSEGFEVFMMTPDKDYGQLVDEHIFLYKPAFMGNSFEVMGIPEILKKWDIERIDQVVDMLGMQGDAVDNIPGIPGIGPKTAAKLLHQFGSVEGVIENSDKLKGKQKERVEENAEQAILSKELARIKTDVPIECEVERMTYNGFDEAALKELFEELEFRTLGKRILGEELKKKTKAAPKKPAQGQQMSLFGAQPAAAATAEVEEEEEQVPATHLTIDLHPHDYRAVTTAEERKRLIHFLSLQKEFCFDTETTGVDPFEAELVGMSFGWKKGEAFYVPVPADEAGAKAIVAEFAEVFANPATMKIAQNIKYDMIVLENYGVKVKGKLFDTMLAHYLLEPDKRHNMDVLADTYLNYTPVSIETLIGKKGKKQGSMRDVDLALITEYASEDADITFQLKEELEPLLKKEAKLQELFSDVECELVPVLAAIERNGVKIDTEALKIFSDELQVSISELEKSIYQEAGTEFNINSPKQMGEVLFDKIKLVDKPKKTKTGQYATGEEILVNLASEHKIVENILEYRQLQKLKSTYVDALPELISPKDNLIHTSYNQAVAATGRLSSTNPNLQNIPIRTDKGREIRKAFVPRNNDYVIMAADYSQVELRIMASFSKDEVMIDAFRQGRDIHATTAAKIYNVPLEEVDGDMRRKAKTANFGIIYGISAFGLSQRLNIPRKEAAEIIDAYFNEFPSIKAYMDEIVNFARENEYVETILGRRRYLRDINSRNANMRGFAERNAINAPIQGSAADVIKMAMIKIQNWMVKEGLKSKMIMQVHDELVFDVYKSELELLKSKVTELMENAVELEVPLMVEAGVGETWLEAH
ncbi:DNA polymerase I [Flammeovirgaceae bacterium SG7u.111]|nr:DNA polymerase I [Flammeovirgaceae bacterium SG7u.132]WPO37341.1 DNA polymerase I [Flammeovirgaceae bacterium SG7u.111]